MSLVYNRHSHHHNPDMKLFSIFINNAHTVSTLLATWGTFFFSVVDL